MKLLMLPYLSNIIGIELCTARHNSDPMLLITLTEVLLSNSKVVAAGCGISLPL